MEKERRIYPDQNQTNTLSLFSQDRSIESNMNPFYENDNSNSPIPHNKGGVHHRSSDSLSGSGSVGDLKRKIERNIILSFKQLGQPNDNQMIDLNQVSPSMHQASASNSKSKENSKVFTSLDEDSPFRMGQHFVAKPSTKIQLSDLNLDYIGLNQQPTANDDQFRI